MLVQYIVAYSQLSDYIYIRFCGLVCAYIAVYIYSELNYVVHYNYYKDSQKIKIKKKTKTPRITDEGWNSQKQLSDLVEKKMKEGKRRKKRLLYLHSKLSSGLVPL